jgi:mono/diheme cytochrome c family protein
MNRGWCVSAGVSLALVVAGLRVPAASSPQQTSAQTPARAVASTEDYRPLLTQYCVTCHNAKTKTGGLELDAADLSQVGHDPELWEKVIKKLRAGMMPPLGMPSPGAETRKAFVGWLETRLDQASAASPNPGRPLVHRLNRAEYANAIRDLLALDVDPSNLLPSDDSSSGFDNIADVLGVSPVLLESYLSAADRISALAVGDPKAPPSSEVYRVRQDASQSRHVEGLPLGTVGGFVIERTLPLDGEYEFQVRLFRTNLGTMRGLEQPHQLEISVDGRRVHLASFGGDKDVSNSSANPTLTGDEIDNRFTVRVPLKAGPRSIAVAFIEKTSAYNSRRLQSYIRSSADTIDFSGFPHIDQFILTGPFKSTGVGDTPSRRKIFICRPLTASAAATPATGITPASRRSSPSVDASGSTESRRRSLPVDASEVGCAKRILSTLARRAYRGDVTPKDIETLMTFYARGRSETGRFDGGVEMALRRLLASPKFVFRVEREPANVRPGDTYRLGDLELASRLSFFLWSSIPDEELLRVAEHGGLQSQAVLDQQVRRMLADPKAQALVSNFAGQWLHLRNLRTKVPNSFQFPDFDDDLRRAMVSEVELFFTSVMAEDRNVLDLMTADYTFVNERLARHYGIPGVYGSQMRRVTLTDEARDGLLGKGALLMVTSHAHRTSPVLRGKWILENIMGVSPAPPPDNVPALSDEEHPNKPRSGREVLEQHRANQVCASCHRVLDPIGFALENYDAVGAWRTRDGGTLGDPIDASGQLVDGTKVDGVVALRKALVRDPQVFVRTMTEKLLTYAVGRGLTATDMPAVRKIVRDAAAKDYRISAMVLGIVNSPQFGMRLKQTDLPTTKVAAK